MKKKKHKPQRLDKKKEKKSLRARKRIEFNNEMIDEESVKLKKVIIKNLEEVIK